MAGYKEDTPDELFEVRNAFYAGNFQHCINEAQHVNPSSKDSKIERDVFLYRAYVAQGKYGVVLDEIKPSFPDEVKSVRILADFLNNRGNKDAAIVEMLEEKLKSTNFSEYFLLIAATIYMHLQDTDSALRCLYQSTALECLALSTQIYLSMDRLDLAKKELSKMQEADEDATLTQLAMGWFNLAVGGEKCQDAYYIFQELADKHTSTVMLLNSQAACYLRMGKLEEAESTLKEALEKDANDADTLVNMVVLSQLSGKSTEVVNRFVSQLKSGHPTCRFSADLVAKEEEFDRCAAAF